MECKQLFKGLGFDPFLGMMLVQLITTGMQILSRIILIEGGFVFALMTYRLFLAAICVAPFALILERGNGTKLTMLVGFWVFLCSLFGMPMGIGLYYYGVCDTNATYASNFMNMIPVATFLFSIITRMENLNLRTIEGKVKIVGTVLCLIGALLISLYKGKFLIFGHRHVDQTKTIKPHFTRGTIFLVASVFSDAIWFIVQAKLMKAFPSKYWATMLTCLSGSFQSAVIGVCLDRRMVSWKFGWNLELLTIVYSGVLASGTSFCIISWVVSCRGPTYPSMFNPLSLVFIATTEILLLGEDLRTGSLIGMLVTIVGVYAFLWGDSKEKKTEPSLPKSPNGEAEEAES